jgi:CBS domain-containing protein
MVTSGTREEDKMKVSEVYWPSVIWVSPGQPLQKAARRMREFDISCVVVMEHGELLGVLTDHDLLRAMADGVDPAAADVADYMTSGPVTVDASAEISVAAAAMIRSRSRHMPVVEHGSLVGMLSARDVLIEAANGRSRA